jgi:large repetitive protein
MAGSVVQTALGGSASGTTGATATGHFVSNTVNHNALVLVVWATASTSSASPFTFTPTTAGVAWNTGSNITAGPITRLDTVNHIARAFAIYTALDTGVIASGTSTSVAAHINSASACDVEFCLIEVAGLIGTSSSAHVQGKNASSATPTTPSFAFSGNSTLHPLTGFIVAAFCGEGSTALAAGSGYTLGPSAISAVLGECEFAPSQGDTATANWVGTNPLWAGGGVWIQDGTVTPTVVSCSPSSGSTVGGTSVTLTGTNFTGTPTVTFGGVSATSIVVVNSTTITCTTPAHAAGAANIVVTTTAGSGTLNSGFTFVAPPIIASIVANSGSIFGGTVTINGTGFQNGATVTFGGVSATGVVFVSSTELTVNPPAHAAGVVTVVVTNPDSQSGSLLGYTYVNGLHITGGNFQSASGVPLDGGRVDFRLNTDAVTAGGFQLVAGRIISFTLDSNGDLDGYIWPNDQLTPTNTKYIARAYTAQGQFVWSAEFFITTPSPLWELEEV